MNRKLLLVVLSASVAIQIASLLLGNTAYGGEPLAGRLQGVTLRADDRPLPQVVVIVHNLGENVDRAVMSNADGTFAVGDLKPGHYQLTATKPGFEASQVTYVVVSAGDDLRFDLKLGEPAPTASTGAATAPTAPSASDPDAPSAIARELDEMKEGMDAMRARMEELEAKLKTAPAEPPATPANAPAIALAKRPMQGQAPTESSTAPAAAPAGPPKKIDPFSDYDWTWLNGNPRTKTPAFDSPFFTPEIRADLTYTYDFNNPNDNSMGGSSELFRANEVQLEQLGIGGDFHFDNVRARFMTQFGMYSTATIRNDPSYSRGQWNIADADRYLSEAYGGYHINKFYGINVDAGIFMSYIGLFSYYNFDNWAYQPSYVSSNTPWFFQGVRIQIFPTAHLKIEPWIINGWQSYASSNSRKGLGGQIKYTPFSWMNIVSNNYGLGHDDLYITDRARIHTDNSIEIKYYDHPESMGLSKMAFSFTGDIGCEFGGGVSCWGDKKGGPKQSFIGYMVYDRYWFHKDLFGLTLGSGQINNPGRYLVLLPPINGETASTAAANAPYFTGNPGDPFKAWDTSVTFDYMPKQYITFRAEADYRHASVPYWSGAGGVTPPGGTNVGTYGGPSVGGGAADLICAGATDSGVEGNVENPASLSQANVACGGNPVLGAPIPNAKNYPALWFPDLRRDEMLIDFDLMVKF
jgi:putative OmpL-like beta-barrel porin-2/carboxypeptidase family protein